MARINRKLRHKRMYAARNSKAIFRLPYSDCVLRFGVACRRYADFRTALSTSVLPSDQIAPGTL